MIPSKLYDIPGSSIENAIVIDDDSDFDSDVEEIPRHTPPGATCTAQRGPSRVGLDLVRRSSPPTGGAAVMNHNTRPRLPPSVSLACEPPAPVLYWQQATGAPHGPWPTVIQVCFVMDLQHVLVLAVVTLVLWNV